MTLVTGGPGPGLARLWAGWRSDYIDELTATQRGSDTAPEHVERCPFCRILASGLPDDDTFIVGRSATAFCILNAYPYTAGHVLVLPFRHVGRLDELTPAEAAQMWELTQHGVGAVERAYLPEGVNVGANLGRAAGAGVPGHLHFHVLPRWFGDSNFMTSIAEARVIPESLTMTAAKLRAVW
jgi:diadenosine tetraphosphate (Ap4A) HIT family hydrolase